MAGQGQVKVMSRWVQTRVKRQAARTEKEITWRIVGVETDPQ